jgi:hypothetical protein
LSEASTVPAFGGEFAQVLRLTSARIDWHRGCTDEWHMYRDLWLGLLVVLGGCQPSMADPPKRERDPDTMRMHMQGNFDLSRAIERLLIRGKLDDAKRFASAIAMVPDPPAHGPWASRVVAVRDHAGALSRATSVDQGIREVARLGAACGDCHTDVSGSLSFENPPAVPPDKPTIEARMLRHRWAADRMWEGIVGNSDKAWRAGLEILSTSPLPQSGGRAELAVQLKKLADRGRRENARVVGRATIYGEILQVCASCHSAPDPTPR